MIDEATRRQFIEKYELMVAKALAKNSRLPWDDKSFEESALGLEFDAKHQINILLDERPSYFAHKEVIFQILCMNVLVPKQIKYRKAAAIITMSDHLVKAYKRSMREWKHPALAEQMANVHIAGPIFFDQIYYPLGGIKAVRDAPTRGGWRLNVLEHADDVYDVVKLMTIYHYHYSKLRDNPKYNVASFNKGATLIKNSRKNGDRKLSKSTVHQRWAATKDSAAFLYAASSIDFAGKSLLAGIIEDRLSFKHVEPVFPEWMGRSRYAASEILMHCYELKTATKNLAKLPEVQPIPFKMASLPSGLAEQIDQAFTSKPRGRPPSKRK